MAIGAVMEHDVQVGRTLSGKGLPEFANQFRVKITDFGGHLVNEGKSNGGLYVWDGLDLSGRKVASGMYTVWISAGDGLEQPDTKIIKIAVVR